MSFVARSRWCHPDHVDPNTYNVGFEVVQMAPSDMVIFQRMFDKYGSEMRERAENEQLYKTDLPEADVPPEVLMALLGIQEMQEPYE